MAMDHSQRFLEDSGPSEPAEERLRREQERFEFALDAADMVAWEWDPATDEVVRSANGDRILGLPPGVLRHSGREFSSLLHPEDRERVLGALHKAFDQGSHYEEEFRIVRPDGAVRWIADKGRVTPGPSGRPCVSGVMRDITERRRTELLLERYQLLAQDARDIVLFVRPDGRIAGANDAAEATYGYDRETLMGMTVFELRAPDTVPLITEQIVRADREGVMFETVHRRRDGSLFPVEVSSRGADVAGERLLLSLIRDITDRKRAEQALREADRRKDEFLATLAHELRNPLAPIRNAVQVLRLKETSAEPEMRWARDVIDRQVEQLTRLVDDLLDVSRITRGKIELRRERVELAAILDRALETSRPLIEASRHRLTVSYPEEPLELEADLTRIAQALANLLNNAAKYTRAGGHIQLSAGRPHPQAVIRVRDDGIGIPPEMLSRVFEMFAQVDTSLERAQGGLGIGLTIARRLVEMHGGTLAAASDGPGKGSELTLRLPLPEGRPVQPPLPAEREGVPAGGLRILVVDDNEDSAESLAVWLRLNRHDVWTARDGFQALEIAEETRPQVVLLDIGMPGMNGYEVARRLRERPATRDVLLFAMTGWGQDEDRRRSREAGFDQHLVKPLDPRALEELLARVVRPRP